MPTRRIIAIAATGALAIAVVLVLTRQRAHRDARELIGRYDDAIGLFERDPTYLGEWTLELILPDRHRDLPLLTPYQDIEAVQERRVRLREAMRKAEPIKAKANAMRAEESRAEQEAKERFESFSKSIDESLTQEEHDGVDLAPELTKWLSPATEIEGQWDSQYWHDGNHLTIRKTASGDYAVTHFSRGDLYSFVLERTGTFNRGVLVFNRPVKGYAPSTPYTRYYLLATPQGLRFASQATARKDIVGHEKVKWDFLDGFSLLRRREDKPGN